METHDEVDRAVGRREPVRFLVGPGLIFLDVERQPALSAQFYIGQHWQVDQVPVDRVLDQQLRLAVIHRHPTKRHSRAVTLRLRT